MTRARPTATPAKRPTIPSGTANPTIAPTPNPIAAQRMIEATIRLPATTGEVPAGRRGRLIVEVLGGFGVGHAGLVPRSEAAAGTLETREPARRAGHTAPAT